MKGEELKKRLTAMGHGNMSELSRLLGMPSSQNLYAALSAQDVKTGLVEDIARAIGRPVTDFYPSTKVVADSSIVVGENATNRNSFNGSRFVVEEQAKQITMLVEELAKYGKRVDTLLNIISK